jgi:hypothetical protein
VGLWDALIISVIIPILFWTPIAWFALHHYCFSSGSAHALCTPQLQTYFPEAHALHQQHVTRVEALHSKLAIATGGVCTFDITAAASGRGDQRLNPWVQHDIQLVQTWQKEWAHLRLEWEKAHEHLASLSHQLILFDSWNDTRESSYQHLLLPDVQSTAIIVQYRLLHLGLSQLQYARAASYAQLLQQLQPAGLCNSSRGPGGALSWPTSNAAAQLGAAAEHAKTRSERARKEVQALLPEYVRDLQYWERKQPDVGATKQIQRLGEMLRRWADPNAILSPSYQQAADRGKTTLGVSRWGPAITQGLKHLVTALGLFIVRWLKHVVSAWCNLAWAMFEVYRAPFWVPRAAGAAA